MNTEKQLDKKIKNLEFVKGAIIKDLNLLKQTSYKKLYNSEVKRAKKIIQKLINACQTKMDNLNHTIDRHRKEST